MRQKHFAQVLNRYIIVPNLTITCWDQIRFFGDAGLLICRYSTTITKHETKHIYSILHLIVKEQSEISRLKLHATLDFPYVRFEILSQSIDPLF